MALQKIAANLVIVANLLAAPISDTPDPNLNAHSQKVLEKTILEKEEEQVLVYNPAVFSETEKALMVSSAVEFRWDPGKTYGKSHESLGTKIDTHLVLTHNHFSDFAGTHISDPGNPDRLYGVSEITISRTAGDHPDFGPQTKLVDVAVPLEGSYAQVAEQETIDQLEAGDFVQVVYWDDAQEMLDVVSLPIKEFLDGVVVELVDQKNIINEGDSGGGVFYNGQLIGNTWRFIECFDSNGDWIEKVVHVQLVPIGAD